MESFNRGYSSLSSQQAEAAISYAWWWRLVSFLSSFLILLGFITLQPLFEDDPKLRLSTIALSIIAVAFFTAGFAMSALLCFACRDAEYQLNVVFTPALFACATGFLTTFYHLAISSRYSWEVATSISTVLGVVSSGIYLALIVLTQRRRSNRRPVSSIDQPGNRIRTLFGLGHKPSDGSSARNPIITIGSDQAPIEIIPGTSGNAEDELTRQQMLGLLKHRENMRGKASDASLQSTFNIELPPLPKTVSENRLSMPPHVRNYYSPLNPNAAVTATAPPRPTRTASESTMVNPSIQNSYITKPVTLDNPSADERARSRSREDRRMAIELGEERARSRSRDLRRREIETGQTGFDSEQKYR